MFMDPVVNSGPPTSAIVPVESAWWSRINWVAAVGIVFAVLALLNIKVPDDLKDAIIQITAQLVSIVIPAVIMLLRTKYSKSVTPSAVASLPIIINQQNTIASVTPAGSVADAISHDAALDS